MAEEKSQMQQERTLGERVAETVKRNFSETLDIVLNRSKGAPAVDQKELREKEHELINCARGAKELQAAAISDQNGSTEVRDYVGLAFSGGGIRSATFNLGVLQALARHRFLGHIDYLSTVSGGGYIGAWLVAWLKRLAEPAGNPNDDYTKGAAQALNELEDELGKEESSEPIRHLRRYSNYLTPANSLFSADTWTMVAILSRNLLLNLAIIVCVVSVAMILPRLAGRGLNILEPPLNTNLSPYWITEAVVSLIILLWCAFRISRYLAPVNRRAMDMQDRTMGLAVDRTEIVEGVPATVQWQIVAPLLLASAVMTSGMFRNREFFHDAFFFPFAIWLTAGLALCFGVVTIRGGFLEAFIRLRNSSHSEKSPKEPLQDGIIESKRKKSTVLGVGIGSGILIALGSGFVTASILFGFARVLSSVPLNWDLWAYIVFGPAAVLLALAIGMVCLVGLIGTVMPDAGREWLGRLRGWSVIYAGIWLVLFAASIYGPWLLYKAGIWAASSAGSVWLLTTIGGLITGKSAGTSGQNASGKNIKDKGREVLAGVAPYVFMAGIFIIVAWGIHVLTSPGVVHGLRHDPGSTVTLPGNPKDITLTVGAQEGIPFTTFETRAHDYAEHLVNKNPPNRKSSEGGVSLFFLLISAVGAGGILAWRVDINEFSMHYFYKNRLVRAYLGASRNRDHRQTDWFTEFDYGDDFPLASLCPEVPRKGVADEPDFAKKVYCGPYPIINGALNLAGAKALAWQERRAASYIFTPLYSGYEKVLVDQETSGQTGGESDRKAYRATKECGGGNGIQIGTAMAISGAAANPNCGYHTSTAVAFFLSVLNVRLGWWLGNPSHQNNFNKSGPQWGLPYLLVELFGLAHKDRGYVNVSDGGHFENLGIYELVRRRCKYIIACDAEQDSEMTFGGLAGAIRKCATDFGVEIEINLDRLKLNDKRGSDAHCAVGTIHYGKEKDQKGYLVYLKSSLTGDEDSDVLEYHSRCCEFPQQSTADQWFDESQFESYRRLGFHVAETTFGAVEDLNKIQAAYKEQKDCFFEQLKIAHHPPSRTIRESFTRHTDHLSRILEAVAADQGFSKYDKSIFNNWSFIQSVTAQQVDRRACYWCTSLLRLMEDVYVDLNFHSRREQEHPENAGWMELFRSWSVTPLFRSTWKIAGNTYGARFRSFFEELQKQQTARVAGQWTGSAGNVKLTVELHAAPECELAGTVRLGTETMAIISPDFDGASLYFACSGRDVSWTFEIQFSPITDAKPGGPFNSARLNFGKVQDSRREIVDLERSVLAASAAT